MFVGYFLTGVIAAPLMAVVVYFLAIMPSLIKHPEYRALSADRSGCCGLEQQVDWFSIATPFLIAIGCILVSIAMASWLWIRGGFYPLFGLIGLASLITGIMLPSQMEDAWAVSARDADQLICESSANISIEYCVWPEQRASLGFLLEVGDLALTTWGNQELITLPRRVSSQAPTQVNGNEGAIAVSFPPEPSKGDIALSLAIGSLPDPAQCRGPAPERFDYFELVIWLMIDAGTSPDDQVFEQFQTSNRAGPLDQVQSITHQPIEDQLTWFSQNEGLLAACQTRPAE